MGPRAYEGRGAGGGLAEDPKSEENQKKEHPQDAGIKGARPTALAGKMRLSKMNF